MRQASAPRKSVHPNSRAAAPWQRGKSRPGRGCSRHRCSRPCARRCAWRSQAQARCRRTCGSNSYPPARIREKCAPAVRARSRCRYRAPGRSPRRAVLPPSTMTLTPPLSVNLIALPARLSSTWRNRASSPTTHAGSRSSTSEAISSPFAWARGPSSSTTSSTSAIRPEWPRRHLELAGLDLGEVENLRDQREQGVARGLRGANVGGLLGRERRVEQQVGHAEDAVERRADFVTDHGQKARLGAIGGFRRIARLAERPFGIDAVGDVAADALHFGAIVGVHAHDHFAPGDPARAGRGHDFLVMLMRAVGQRRGLALFEHVERGRWNPTRSSCDCPASAQKASLA